jgi:hypothetical protein
MLETLGSLLYIKEYVDFVLNMFFFWIQWKFAREHVILDF